MKFIEITKYNREKKILLKIGRVIFDNIAIKDNLIHISLPTACVKLTVRNRTQNEKYVKKYILIKNSFSLVKLVN